MIHLFNEKGLAALDPQWAGGRPRLISYEDIEFIVMAATGAVGPDQARGLGGDRGARRHDHHHHAVGRDHRRWYLREVPPLFAGALRGAKRELDPAGIMNPGVLLKPTGAVTYGPEGGR